MPHPLSVLVIDDDAISRKVISRSVQDEYQVHLAKDGTEGVQKALELHPDLVLLDVEMPGINGFETCDQLHNNAATQDIPVIFLSSRSSLRERMLGYEVGAVDYFIKPFNKEELMARVDVIRKYQQRHTALLSQAEDASNTAMIAMRGAGELGNVLGFLEGSYQINSFQELGNILIQTLTSFGLNVCFFMTMKNDKVFFSSSSGVTPIEKELMSMLRDANRFHDFGRRTQVNYPRISLLVKNMPLDDMDKYGRYKDLLASLVSASDTKINIIEAQRTLFDQTKDLSRTMNDAKIILEQLSNAICANQQQSVSILKNMFDSLERSVPGMGLEEDQEVFLLELADKSVQKVSAAQQQGIIHIDRFKSVLNSVEQVSLAQARLIEDVFAREGSVKHTVSVDDDTDSLGVDLF